MFRKFESTQLYRNQESNSAPHFKTSRRITSFLFLSPFSFSSDEAPEGLQMECAYFHCASGSKDRCNNFSMMGFNKNLVSQERYPGVHNHAIFMISLF
jgi:hypothetical protein